VVGHPVAHSLSPAMHRAAYAALGLDWSFEAVDVEPGALRPLVGSLDPTWRALAVTAPHKRDALDLADEASEVARRAGGANTLLLDPTADGTVRVRADNTDVPGARAALAEAGVDDVPLVRVLGAGATASSVAHAVAALGARAVELVVRDPGRADETVASIRAVGLEVRVRHVDDAPTEVADLLVSTVPEQVAGERAEAHVSSARAVFDVVYDPWPTQLATAAARAQLPTVTGLDLLAHQAVLQLALMTGRTVDVHTVRDAALEALASA
jgi:shikimate dehydrogenase